MLGIGVLTCLLMAILCYSLQKNWATITADKQMEVTKKILVYPDELKFNGNWTT